MYNNRRCIYIMLILKHITMIGEINIINTDSLVGISYINEVHSRLKTSII